MADARPVVEDHPLLPRAEEYKKDDHHLRLRCETCGCAVTKARGRALVKSELGCACPAPRGARAGGVV